jgi:hypothetical protein
VKPLPLIKTIFDSSLVGLGFLFLFAFLKALGPTLKKVAEAMMTFYSDDPDSQNGSIFTKASLECEGALEAFTHDMSKVREEIGSNYALFFCFLS